MGGGGGSHSQDVFCILHWGNWGWGVFIRSTSSVYYIGEIGAGGSHSQYVLCILRWGNGGGAFIRSTYFVY